MSSQTSIQLASLPDFNPFPGYVGKLVHGETMTIIHWEIQADCEVPLHSHPHEQIVNVMQGEFVLVLDGEPIHMHAGDVLVIPGDVPHSGRSITDCRIIDVWHPTRDDYQVE